MPNIASVEASCDARPEPGAEPGPLPLTATRDGLIVVALTVVTAALCARFDVSELLHRWTAPWERIQLDELPAICLVLALGLCWFALRRFRETRSELVRRRAAESRAGLALAHVRRLSQRHIEVQEQERRSIARELHDELGQYLQVIKLDAVGLRDKPPSDSRSLADRAEAIVDNCNHLHAMLTGLLQRLRPVGLDELGLVAALEHCIQSWQPRLPATTLTLTVTGEYDDVSEAASLAVYRLVQESLTNIAKHAGARRAAVQLRRDGDAELGECLVVEVTDDGAGFDVGAPTQGLGLIGMRERISGLGGRSSLDAGPGRGTRVRAWIPIARSTDRGV